MVSGVLAQFKDLARKNWFFSHSHSSLCQPLRLFLPIISINLWTTLLLTSLSGIRLCFSLFMHHTPSRCLSGRDWVTNTQASVVHLSRLFHSLCAMPSYCICGLEPQLTLCWPLPRSGQNRKRKQTGISGGSHLPPCLSAAGEGLWCYYPLSRVHIKSGFPQADFQFIHAWMSSFKQFKQIFFYCYFL